MNTRMWTRTATRIAAPLMLLLSLVPPASWADDDPCTALDPLARLICIDDSVAARVSLLDDNQRPGFDEAAAQCSRPLVGVQWLRYRICVIDALPGNTRDVNDALENWSQQLQALSDQLREREALLDRKDDLLEQVGALVTAFDQRVAPDDLPPLDDAPVTPSPLPSPAPTGSDAGSEASVDGVTDAPMTDAPMTDEAATDVPMTDAPMMDETDADVDTDAQQSGATDDAAAPQ